MKNYILLPLSLVLMLSCKKPEKECTIVCSDQDFAIRISTTYTEEEADTVIIKKFVKATGLNKLISTTILYREFNDPFNGLGRFQREFDYTVELPSVKRTYSITEIEDEKRTTITELCKNNVSCINGIVSHKINGQIIFGDIAILTK
jgi:hypothetical protein